MIHKFNATFCLRSGRVNKDGTVSVLLRMRLNDERINICTGICVCPKFWNQGKQCVSSRSPDAVMQNSMLHDAYHNIYETFRKKEALMGAALTAATIRDAFLGKDRIRHEFISVYETFLKRKKRLESANARSKDTLQKYNVALKHFKTFLKSQYGKEELYLDEFNAGVILDFETYMLTEAHHCHNSAVKVISKIKTVVLDSIKRELMPLRNNPFNNFPIVYEDTETRFLSSTQLQVLMLTKFENTRLSKVRDIFVLSCLTGLAFCDMAKLTEENIVEQNGWKWIMVVRQKTKKPSYIPLLPEAERIIAKYHGVDRRGRLLPAMCNKCTNEYLKEIAAKCQIYEELHYHMSRHTFATIAISNGFPLESVQYILGHTTMKQTLHYAKILSTKVLDDMRQLGEKLSELKLPDDF